MVCAAGEDDNWRCHQHFPADRAALSLRWNRCRSCCRRSTRPNLLRRKCEEILKTAPDHRSHCSDGESLTCSGVRFHYPNSSNGIQSFDFCFLPSRKYWIAGGSGSGKSTIAKLIAGLYRCEGGEIRYPHTAEDQPQVIYIPQKAHIFRDTLRNNLTMRSSFSDSQRCVFWSSAGSPIFLPPCPTGSPRFWMELPAVPVERRAH